MGRQRRRGGRRGWMRWRCWLHAAVAHNDLGIVFAAAVRRGIVLPRHVAHAKNSMRARKVFARAIGREVGVKVPVEGRARARVRVLGGVRPSEPAAEFGDDERAVEGVVVVPALTLGHPVALHERGCGVRAGVVRRVVRNGRVGRRRRALWLGRNRWRREWRRARRGRVWRSCGRRRAGATFKRWVWALADAAVPVLPI